MSSRSLIARFEIRQVLGQGALGMVYRALDRELSMEIALKVLPARLYADANQRNVFLAACRQASRLSHPYLVRVLAADANGPHPCFASRLVQGTTLQRTLERRKERSLPYSLTEVVRVITQLAVGLDLLETGIPAHGLLSPRNVFVLPGHVKLSDYHLAVTLTRSDLVKAYAREGSPSYLAPEAQLGHPLSPAADVFSLGMIAAQLLLGRPVEGGLVDLSRARPDLPAGLGELLSQALYFDPGARPRGPKALAAGMRRFLDDTEEADRLEEVPAPVTAAAPVWGAEVREFLRSRGQS